MKHTFLPKPQSITLKVGSEIRIIGQGTRFSVNFIPGDILRFVQRLPGGGIGHDYSVTIKNVLSDTEMLIKEDELPGLHEDLEITGFLGYKRSRKD